MSSDKYNGFQDNNLPTVENNKTRDVDSTVQGFIQRYLTPIIKENSLVLNVGSTSSFGLPGKNMYHFPSEKIDKLPNDKVNNFSSMLLSSNEYEIVICTSEGLNNADPMEVFDRFSNLVRPGGYLVLEFENSNTLELLFKEEFNRKAVFVDASGNHKKRWHYSDSWMKELLVLNKFELIKKHKFHYSLSFGNRVCDLARRGNVIKLHSILRLIPFIQNLSSNTIILCKKN